MQEAGRFLRAREDVDRAGALIDYGSGSDANFRESRRAGDIPGIQSTDAVLQEAGTPERRGRAAVSIEGVNAVVFGRDEQHVVHALAGIGTWGKYKGCA